MNPEEQLYLDSLKEVLSLKDGPNRTGVSTKNKLFQSLQFSLTDDSGNNVLPLLTTKKVNFRSIFLELIWFLRGSTDTKFLVDNNVHIWDDNANDGQVGPIYGKQWRDWGGKHDQIGQLIDGLKYNPSSRRHIVSAWNVEDLDKMVLPPCHYCFQFVVTEDPGPTLNCVVNMRSADAPLGVPFNIASYALLTHMIAKLTHMIPGQLVMNMTNYHIYKIHEEAVKKQVSRKPKPFPTFSFSGSIDSYTTIDDFAHKMALEDIDIHNYNPHSYLAMKMVP
jgi:thymidylate synthase